MSTITLTGDLTITITCPFDGKLATLAEPTRLAPPPCAPVDAMPGESAGVVFGRHIRSLRAEKGWTQADLAERLGTSHQTVARSEAGLRTVGIEELLTLARTFGITMAEFVAPLDARGAGL